MCGFGDKTWPDEHKSDGLSKLDTFMCDLEKSHFSLHSIYLLRCTCLSRGTPLFYNAEKKKSNWVHQDKHKSSIFVHFLPKKEPIFIYSKRLQKDILLSTKSCHPKGKHYIKLRKREIERDRERKDRQRERNHCIYEITILYSLYQKYIKILLVFIYQTTTDNNIKTSKNKLKTRYQIPHHIDLYELSD